MAGNWTDRDPRDREWGWQARAPRHREDDRGREPRSWDRDARPGPYAARRSGPDRDRVFGERDYQGNSPAGGYSRPAPRRAGPRFGSQDYTKGGRFYGDDSREALYPEEYGYDGRGHGAPRGYDSGYGPSRAAGDRTERFEEAGRQAGDFLHRTGEKVARWFQAFGSEGGFYADPEAYAYADAYALDHRGRGPKDYRRPDERISDEAHERLTDDRWLDATNVVVAVSGGEVTLSGTVENREAKHRAERIIERLSGVKHVQNNLRVAEEPFFQAERHDSSILGEDDPVANGSGGAGGGQSTAGRKN